MAQIVRSNVEKHSVKMMEKLNRMKQEKDHCDFVIQVGNAVYDAHKNVLSAGSDYFKAMLKHDTKESRERKVVLKDVDFECVKNCVDFIYSGKLEITDGKMNDLLHVAIMMQLEDVKHIISDNLAESITVENYFSTRNVADMYGLDAVLSRCRVFFHANIMEISNQPEFGNIAKTDILNFVKSEKSELCEEELLMLLLNWVEKNQKNEQHLLESLEAINFDKISPAFLENLLESNSIINNDLRLYKLLNGYLVKAFKRLVKAKEESGNDELVFMRDVRVILNKITWSTFKDLMKQVLALKIDTERKLRGTIDLIFEKAIDKPKFSEVYANMCRQMMHIRVTAEESSDQQNPGGQVEFFRLILTKCQKEFEQDKYDRKHLLELKTKMEANTDQKLAPQLKEEYDTAEFKDRRRTLGNICFIGELFKLRMLTEPIMHNCIMILFKAKDDDHLESLCHLLTTIGKDLDHPKAKERMDQYFSNIRKIIDEKRTSSRVRFMLQDVNDLRANNWVPRAIHTQGPKTISQIHQDAKNEREMLQLKLVCTPNPIQKQGSREKNRMGNRVGHEDGWTKVQTAKPVLFDRSKMKMQCTTLVNVRHDNMRDLGVQPQGQSVSAPKARQNEPSKRYRLEMDLTQLLNKGLSNGDLFDWVEKNLTPEEAVSPDFIRALTISVCRRSLKKYYDFDDVNAKDGGKMTVVEDKITERSILLNRYIENRQERELQVLYALQNLMVELDQPRDVLRRLFHVFYNEDVVQEQTFFNWEKSEDPNEQEGHRVAVASVNMFFRWLRTADPESDGN